MTDEQIIEYFNMPGLNIEASLEPREMDLFYIACNSLLAARDGQSAEQERDAFEANAKVRGYNLNFDKEGNHYYYQDTHERWLGWQARAPLNAPASQSANTQTDAEALHDAWSSTLAYMSEKRASQSTENRGDDAKDAARWRWLLNEHFPTADNPPVAQVVWKWQSDRHGSKWVNMIDGDDLNRHIDAAIAKGEGK